MKFEDIIITLILALWFLYLIAYETKDTAAPVSPSLSAGHNQSEDAEIAPQTADKPYIEVLMNVSAYCTCEICCGRWHKDGFNCEGVRRTASGEPDRGFLVAAPSMYPFGTMMSIEGYAGGRLVPVLDRGGAIKGNKLDLLFSSHQEALEWGRRIVLVKVFIKQSQRG